MTRTREDVAASLNVARRGFAATYEADAARMIADGRAGSRAEAWARLDVPTWLTEPVTPDEVDAFCVRQWEALQTAWSAYQRNADQWSDSAKTDLMAQMQSKQEWLIAAREQFVRPLDAREVKAAEERIERDMQARAKASSD